MPIDVTFSGDGALRAALEAAAAKLSGAAGTALRAEAELIMTEAKKRTPVLTGALRASGHVTGPETKGDEVAVTLAFGGPAAGYAVFVHENMEAHHPVGQAKFLESALLEAAPELPDRVAARMARNAAEG